MVGNWRSYSRSTKGHQTSQREGTTSVVEMCVYDVVSHLCRVSLSTLLVTTAANQEKSIW